MLPLEVEEFLTWLVVERGRATNTIISYRRDLRAWWTWLDTHGLSLDTVRANDVELWARELRESPLAPASAARRVVAVRSLHRFLAAEGLVEIDPTASLERARVPSGLPKALSEPEVAALFDVVVGDDPVARRDRALLEVLYGTGARISEAVALSVGDVDVGAGLLRLFGKGSKERIVPVGRLGREALDAWLGSEGRGRIQSGRSLRRTDLEAVFVNRRGARLTRQGAWGIVRRHATTIGLEDRLSPHVLRHSCATHMLDRGADIRAVQELLGHASISTTQVYTKVAPERLRAVFDQAHPRARRS